MFLIVSGRLFGTSWEASWLSLGSLGMHGFPNHSANLCKQSVFVKTIAFAMLALLVQFIWRASRIQFDSLHKRVGLGYQHEICLFRQRYLPLAPLMQGPSMTLQIKGRGQMHAE